MTQLKRLQNIMKQQGVEGILLSSEVNQRYISGFDFQDGYIVVLQDKAFVLTDFRYIEAANAQVNHDDFEIVTPKGGHLKYVATLAEEQGIRASCERYFEPTGSP